MPYDNSIRLLRIYKGAPSAAVEVSLDFAHLTDTSPPYEALSYVWGSGGVSHIVHQPTQMAIPVTRNLYDALKGVRQVEKDRVIWVDALCINQTDGKEKGIQVRKMNSIYARASRVVVWLGTDEAGDANGAFRALCALANSKGASAQYSTKSQTCTPPACEVFYPKKDNFDLCSQVMRFFCQTWYTRLWVLQEIVLAQDAIFVWGDCSISWAHVGLAIEVIEKDRVMSRLFGTRNLQNAYIMWRLSVVNNSMERAIDKSKSNLPEEEDINYSFLHLLDMARSFEVTDPRDKIYGILGFPTTGQGLNADSIIPDYTLSASEVYIQVTRSLLDEEQNLDILALVLNTPLSPHEAPVYIDGLPSWVPNFFSGETAFPFSNSNIGHQYTAGFSRPIEISQCAAPRVLGLRGAVLDTIQTVGSSIPLVDLYAIGPHLQVLIQWCNGVGISATTLAATLTAGRNKYGQLLSERERNELDVNLAAILESLKSESSLSELPADRQGLDVSGGSEWRAVLWRFIVYRQPFVTKLGEFGLGPRGMEEGDSIIVLWGGQCPFVTRKAEQGQWHLKGECFVESWVHGDAVEVLVRENRTEDTVFRFT